MSAGSLTVTITIPTVNGSPNNASNVLAASLLQQVGQAIGASGTTAGSITYPPGPAPAVVGSWNYSPAT